MLIKSVLCWIVGHWVGPARRLPGRLGDESVTLLVSRCVRCGHEYMRVLPAA